MVPLLFPAGTLMVGPSLTPSTMFDTASGTWQTKQTVAVGAVNLTDISFISAAVAALPDSTGVRASDIFRFHRCHSSKTPTAND